MERDKFDAVKEDIRNALSTLSLEIEEVKEIVTRIEEKVDEMPVIEL